MRMFNLFKTFNQIIIKIFYTTDSAAAANFGHKSAHSLAMGPKIVDPFISPLFETITPALSWK